jgi:hypothetical protein
MMELTYTADKNGILYPNLFTPNSTAQPLGIWGRRRRDFLKANRKGLYAVMRAEGRLFDHLAEIDRAADAMMESLVPKLAKSYGATEALKATDRMHWVGIVNNARHSAEEIVRAELIYS